MNRRLLGRWFLASVLGASGLSGCAEVSNRDTTLRPSDPLGLPRHEIASAPPLRATPYHTIPSSAAFAAAAHPAEAVPTKGPIESGASAGSAMVQDLQVQTTSVAMSPEIDKKGEVTPTHQVSMEGQIVVESDTAGVQVAESGQGTVPKDSGFGGQVILQASVEQTEQAVAEVPGLKGTLLPEQAPEQSAPRASFPRAEPGSARRSFVDLSAAPCFCHAPDYSWLVGQVEHSRVARQWRLRFASVDEADRYGGRVVLIENQHVSYLADGQYVRVHGHLVNTDDSQGAHYRIESFEAIQDPNAAQAPLAVK
jgi:hypothetical protein